MNLILHQEALASAKWIYSNAQKSANYQFRRRLELYVDNPFVLVLNKDLPQPGRSDELTIHLRAYNQHWETMRKFKENIPPRNPGTQVERDERKKPDETQEALEWIARSYEAEILTDELGHSAPWERLHPDSPGPFLSLGTHFWALIIGNDNYPSVPGAPGLSGCINDAHLVKDYLKEYLHVPGDHIILLENARRNEMIDALYNLRDNETIPFGDNILIHYSGYGSSYMSGNLQGPWVGYTGAICPIDRGCRGVCDISERELDVILSELCVAKGPKITFISDCSYAGSMSRSGGGAAFRVAPPVKDENRLDRLDDMLKLAMTHPRRRSDVNIFSEEWNRDLLSFVHLASGGGSTVEADIGLGKGRHGLFTFAVIKVLESEEGRETTYEGLLQIIGRLRQAQRPVGFGMRKMSLLWFRNIQEELSLPLST